MASVPRTTTGARHSIYHGSAAGTRPAALGLAKLLFLGASQISMAGAAPLKTWLYGDDEGLPDDPEDPSLWLYMTIAMILVLAGGAFAGLTIALMGQDGIYLQVIATSGEGKEQRHAQRVYRLLKRGKHWVLVTLLLANVIVNETLPIVLDRSLGGGWPAVLGSTALIVIFGEVIPQSICVRYGMQIGAYMAPCVLVLMYLLAPIAWPTAKLLDWLLGEDHGTVYKKSGLKTLVTLHKTLGPSPSDRLNEDEVTIISAVLDLKDKPVGDIMTPMEDVFTMSSETVLDEKTMDTILSAGYSRIPIYEPGNESNFIGMLLVKMLITYDPEDCKKVGEFALATLPETRPETSCLDIVNFFQEGKSHMVLVSECPGEDHGATGVVTLEDVIEELIGEEIIDESDVYIDVHKAIRRLAPAPTARRVPKGQVASDTVYPKRQNIDASLVDIEGEPPKDDTVQRRQRSLDSRASATSPAALGTSPKATFMIRRGSSAADGNTLVVRGNVNEMREHLKHLGPSNLAARPKQTRYQTVKIKPGHPVDTTAPSGLVIEEPYHDEPHLCHGPNGGEGESLLRSGGRDALDAVHAVQQGYGSIVRTPQSPEQFDKVQQVNFEGPNGTFAGKVSPSRESPDNLNIPTRRPTTRGTDSGSDVVVSLRSSQTSPVPPGKRAIARSGSITESVVDANGVRKVVLQTTSSSDGDDTETWHNGGAALGKSRDKGNTKDVGAASTTSQDDKPNNEDMTKKSKRRRKRRSQKDEEHGDPRES